MANLPLPPRKSPLPPLPSFDEPKTDPNMKAQRYDAAKRRRPWWVGLATAAVTAVGALLTHVESRSAELKREREERINDVKRLEVGQFETRQDIRELYHSVVAGRPSERLEHPVPVKDAGP